MFSSKLVQSTASSLLTMEVQILLRELDRCLQRRIRTLNIGEQKITVLLMPEMKASETLIASMWSASTLMTVSLTNSSKHVYPL